MPYLRPNSSRPAIREADTISTPSTVCVSIGALIVRVGGMSEIVPRDSVFAMPMSTWPRGPLGSSMPNWYCWRRPLAGPGRTLSATTVPSGSPMIRDPRWRQTGWVEVPAEPAPHSPTYGVRDLLTGTSYTWRTDGWNYVELDPSVQPAHLMSVDRPLAPEAG